MRCKRWTALLLAVSLLLPMEGKAFADEGRDPVNSGLPTEEEAFLAKSGEEPLCENVGDLLVTQAHDAYISGYKDGSFQPKKGITRAEAAQIFYNLLISEPKITASFSDVEEERWYTTPVLAMASLGAIKGYPNGTFRPDRGITRAEFVTIASRFAAHREGKAEFSDVPESSWAYEAISSACAHGWVGGYPNHTFRPNGNITRAEAVKVVNAMLGRSPDPDVNRIYFTKEFSDVSRTYWAYPQICEAATKHGYTKENDGEHWALPNQHNGTGWEITEEGVRYRDANSDHLLYGFQTIQGYTYYFDMESGQLLTGWQTIGGRHYLLPGLEQQEKSLKVQERLSLVNFAPANRSVGDIRYLTVHYTAEPGVGAEKECESFESTYRGTSAHYFVDETGVWRCVLDRDVSWHCGNDVYYHESCRNANSIGIEMCVEKTDAAHHDSPYDDDWYFEEGTVENTTALIRELMMRYGIPLERVIRHNDVSHKTCPAPYVNDFSAWQDFLRLISDGQSSYTGAYPAAVTASELRVRSGPGKEYASVGTLKKGSQVTVLEETGNNGSSTGRWAKISGGWVSYEYLTRLAE